MVISTITRKNNTSAIVAEKYLSDLDVNQILDVVQDGTKDLNTNTVICQGNNLFVNVNKGVRYNVTLSQMEFSNDGTVWNVMGGNPTVISVLAGEPITIRNACYIGTDGKAYKSTGSKCEGIATSTAVLNAPIELQTSGSLSGFTGLTVGSTYYADNLTSGGITTTLNNNKVGIALTTTSIFIQLNVISLTNKTSAKNSYEINRNGGVFSNDIEVTVDKFTSSTGNNGTVDTINSTAIYNGANYSNFAVNTLETVKCNITILNKSSLTLYTDFVSSAGDVLTVNVSDGTTTTSNVDIIASAYNIIDLAGLNTALALTLTFNLTSPNVVTGNTWATKAVMPTSRYSFTASAVNNKIYCIGGLTTVPLNTNEEYDPSLNTWATKAVMTTARNSFTASAVNNKIYCIGGNNGTYLNTNEEYDPSLNTWITKAVMTTARYGLVSSVINNKIYCIGGYTTGPINTNEEYDPSLNTWATKAVMPTSRYSFTASAVNNKIYCIGGYTTGPINTNEEYDPPLNTWATKAVMPTARYDLTSSAVNNKIYCIGGNNGTYLNTNEEYDPSLNTWITKAVMTTARYFLAASAVNNKIYCIGGYTTGPINTNEEYDPPLNTWATKAVMPTARYDLTSSAVNNKIYCIGGYTTGPINTNEVYLVYISTLNITGYSLN